MDYIQEELRRQQRALIRLLLGGGAAERSQDRTEGAEAPPALPTDWAFRAETSEGAAPQLPEAVSGLGGTAPGATAAPRARKKEALQRLPVVERTAARETGAAWETGMAREADAAWEADTARRAGAALGEALEAGEAWKAEASWEADAVGLSAFGMSSLETALSIGGAGLSQADAAGFLPQIPISEGARFSAGSGGGTRSRTVTEVVAAAPQETADPEALSRVYQRDARRYDGGFPLY